MRSKYIFILAFIVIGIVIYFTFFTSSEVVYEMRPDSSFQDKNGNPPNEYLIKTKNATYHISNQDMQDILHGKIVNIEGCIAEVYSLQTPIPDGMVYIFQDGFLIAKGEIKNQARFGWWGNWRRAYYEYGIEIRKGKKLCRNF